MNDWNKINNLTKGMRYLRISQALEDSSEENSLIREFMYKAKLNLQSVVRGYDFFSKGRVEGVRTEDLLAYTSHYEFFGVKPTELVEEINTLQIHIENLESMAEQDNLSPNKDLSNFFAERGGMYIDHAINEPPEEDGGCYGLMA